MPVKSWQQQIKNKAILNKSKNNKQKSDREKERKKKMPQHKAFTYLAELNATQITGITRSGMLKS